MRAEYVEGIRTEEGLNYPTLDEVGTKYGANLSYLRRKASTENWTGQRKMYQQKIEQARQEKRVNLLATEAAKFDAECLELARVGLNHVRGHFLSAQEDFKSSNGKKAMNATMLEKLSRASERYQKVGRLALGEPTEHNKEDGQDINVITDGKVAEAFAILYGERPVSEGTKE
jgi:hypothetical protein